MHARRGDNAIVRQVLGEQIIDEQRAGGDRQAQQEKPAANETEQQGLHRL